MKIRLTFGTLFPAIIAAVFIIIVISFIGFWMALDAQEQLFIESVLSRHAVFPFFSVFLVIAVIGLALNLLFTKYITPLRKLAEETNLIATVNPDHRIQKRGSAETRQMTEIVNTFADSYQQMQRDIKGQIKKANQEIEEEKNRLAALMAELTNGVIVCNLDGQILLYNRKARALLETRDDTAGFIGLGRSIFGFMDRQFIVHALDIVRQKVLKETHAVSTFVTTLPSGKLARFQLIAVRDNENEISGFILTLEDITQRVEIESRRDILLQSLTEGIRASLGSIRAAIETILDYPHMDYQRKDKFRKIIREESLKLSEHLDRSVSAYSQDLKTQWPLEDIMCSDLMTAIMKRFQETLRVKTSVQMNDNPIWLKVDSYSIIQALTFVMSNIENELAVQEVVLRVQPHEKFARLILSWKGLSMEGELLREMGDHALITAEGGSPLTLNDVVERHSSEMWSSSDDTTGESRFIILLPVAVQQSEIVVIPSNVSRPEFYDFDLFKSIAQNEQFQQQPLRDLSFVIFDTETTGLNPSDGDEIISIGAVRILNGRMLRQETFDQLVDPQRKMSRESIKITGIHPKMLVGQPTIDKVLPRFKKFVEDSVLVAHNAAFDMRFLQIKEETSGVRFDNPVLDTLLLSAVIHPNQDKHNLEAIAERMGIHVIGRHTALGDAIVTAEVFLKLIPLLKEKGITTFGEAVEAAKKTYYARIKY